MRLGSRYRVQYPVPGNRRRTIDIAFTRARLAVFVDGCSGTDVRSTAHVRRATRTGGPGSFDRNAARDEDTDSLLAQAGWRALRLWEHETPVVAVHCVATVLVNGNGSL